MDNQTGNFRGHRIRGRGGVARPFLSTLLALENPSEEKKPDVEKDQVDCIRSGVFDPVRERAGDDYHGRQGGKTM